MGGLFISYRHGDTREFSERLYSRLCETIPADRVFFDREIPLGMNWEQHLQNALAGCSVLIAVIGKSWSPLMEDGKPRVRAARDHVKTELSTAFKRGLTIIPILVDGAEMPRKAELPPSLSRLPKCQALKVGDDFDESMARLTQRLQPLLDLKGRRSRVTWKHAALWLMFALAAVLGGWYHQALLGLLSGVSLKDPGTTIRANGLDAWLSWGVLGIGVALLASFLSWVTNKDPDEALLFAGSAAVCGFVSVLLLKGVVLLFANGAYWFGALAGIFLLLAAMLTLAFAGSLGSD